MTNRWWKPPKLRIGDHEERHATWLELFYDLVFVVAIAQLAHTLSDHVSLSGFLQFIILFVPIWWSWIGTTFYATRFDSDDLGHRLLTAAQMLGIVALSINVHHGLDESSGGFALSYAAVRFVLVIKYLRAIAHIPVARPLTVRYAKGFGLAATLWLISAFVPLPYRFILWGIGLLIDFGTPITAGKLHALLPPHASHFPERMGLFTLIVLGESIVAVVDGVSEQQWGSQSVISAIFGLAIAFSLWWIYFENIGDVEVHRSRVSSSVNAYQAWLYAHLPLVIGITATGVGVEHIVASPSGEALATADRWLFCGAVALCLLALSIIHLTDTRKDSPLQTTYRIGAVALVVLVAILGQSLLPVTLITLVAAICGLEIFLELQHSLPEENTQGEGIDVE